MTRPPSTMPRPQTRSKASHTCSTIDAATAAARARNDAIQLPLACLPNGDIIISTHKDTLLSTIYADSNINPLTASLSLERNDVGKDTCILDGYLRGSPHSPEIEDHVEKIVEYLSQGAVGGRASSKSFEEAEEMFEAFSHSTYLDPSRGCDEIRAFTYGRLVAFFSAAIDIKTATVSKRAGDGFVTIQCVVEDVDVLAEEFEQDLELSQDEIDYVAAKQEAAQTAHAKEESDRHLAEVAPHLDQLAKKPLPYVPKRFKARGKAVFMTFKALKICVPTTQLVITREGKAEMTGYSNATPYTQELQDRINTILIATGLTPSASQTTFGVIPPRITTSTLLKQLQFSIFNLTNPKAPSNSSAKFYTKEIEQVLGVLYTSSNSDDVEAEIVVQPSGFITIAIEGLKFPDGFLNIVQSMLLRIWKRSEGVLSKDEMEFERKRGEVELERDLERELNDDLNCEGCDGNLV